MAWNHAIISRKARCPVRGLLKKLLLFCPVFLIVFQLHTAQLALIVLNTAAWGVSSLPSDWQVKVNHGKPDFSVCTERDASCLHLRSTKSSFALERGVDVDPAQLPYLTWHWKVTQLPKGGDFRHPSTDDQAAQVLVAFDDHRVLSYIWDTNAPKGAEQRSGFIPLIHVFSVVCESGPAEVNNWLAESRNVAADYQRAYGKSAPHVKGLRLQINSQHTGTAAESYFGEVAFRSLPQ
jgi:hypothetical protein